MTNIKKSALPKKEIMPKVFTFDVAFVLTVMAKTKNEAEKICLEQGGYIVSRTQVLKSVSLTQVESE